MPARQKPMINEGEAEGEPRAITLRAGSSIASKYANSRSRAFCPADQLSSSEGKQRPDEVALSNIRERAYCVGVSFREKVQDQ